MERAVLGLNDEASSQTAVDWVIERARSHALGIRLVSELDLSASSPDPARQLLADTARRIQEAAPGTPVETVLVDRPLLHELLEQSESADLLVIGTHPDPGIRESRTASFPVSLAARSGCPTVLVPDDMRVGDGPVVVGVDATGASRAAAVFAAHEAAEADRELEIVHTWEPWSTQHTRASQVEHQGVLDAIVDGIRADVPTVRVRGVLREGVAHEGVIASSQDASLIVLGTHGLGRETGIVLGAIHQEVMIRGRVPLCIVPLGGLPGSLAG